MNETVTQAPRNVQIEQARKNANYLKMAYVLDFLFETNAITEAQLTQAKRYYYQMAGADIIVPFTPRHKFTAA